LGQVKGGEERAKKKKKRIHWACRVKGAATCSSQGGKKKPLSVRQRLKNRKRKRESGVPTIHASAET